MYIYKFRVVEQVEYQVEITDGRNMSLDTIQPLLKLAEQIVRDCEAQPTERRVLNTHFIGRIPLDASDV